MSSASPPISPIADSIFSPRIDRYLLAEAKPEVQPLIVSPSDCLRSVFITVFFGIFHKRRAACAKFGIIATTGFGLFVELARGIFQMPGAEPCHMLDVAIKCLAQRTIAACYGKIAQFGLFTHIMIYLRCWTGR